MRIIVLTLTAVLSAALLNAQGNNPPLPSAKDLAKGNTREFVAALYSRLDNGEAEEVAKMTNEIKRQMGAGKAGGIAAPNQMQGLDMSALSKMSEKEVEAYAMQQAGKMMGMSAGDIKKLEKMSDKEIEAYAMQMAGKMTGMSVEDLKKLEKMSEKEIEAYTMQMASKQTGMSVGDLKKLEKMSDREARAFMENKAKEGTPGQQAYDKEKGAFDRERSSARAKAADDMKRLYSNKYRPLIQKAEEDMEGCDGDDMETERRFEEAYRRWKTAKEDYRVECFDIWRKRIAAEQEGFRKMSQQVGSMRFEGMEGQIAGDYLKITLDVLRLPEGVG